MAYRSKKGRIQRSKVEFPPAIFPALELGCMVRIDLWHSEVKKPGQRKEIEKFAVNLSYSEPLERLEPDWKPVKRYDCAHYRVEQHEYWISHRARRIPQWEEKPMIEILHLAKQDLLENYARYILNMQQKRRRR